MQSQQNINYIFLGSQESMMEEIFERKKSPFYHFGKLMRLSKIPYDDFHDYIMLRLPTHREDVTADILQFTSCHPYYTLSTFLISSASCGTFWREQGW